MSVDVPAFGNRVFTDDQVKIRLFSVAPGPTASQVVPVVKNQLHNTGKVRDLGSIPGSRRSPGKGNGNPFHYFCLENSVDSGAWRATVHRVAQSQTRLKQPSACAHAHTHKSHMTLF